MNFVSLQKALAQNKVYDAWQYVQSLAETLGYMNMSAELLERVYAHRLSVIKETEQSLLQTAIETGQASITEETLKETHLDIAGLKLDDSIFLKKTSLEFFHYARLSMDILFQIINASLLGDRAIDVEDKGIVRKLLDVISQEPNFAALKTMLDSVKTANEFSYLQGFDNYVKHIKTILVNVENSFILGNQNTFQIAAFSYNGTPFPACDTIVKVREIQAYVNHTVEQILIETEKQVPNCLDTQKRIQNLNFHMQVQEHKGTSSIDHISFFIYVNNNLNELPPEINVYPLLIKPNGDIYSFDFRFEEIFIKKRTDDSIVGIAKLKNGLSSNEVYRAFTVSPCDMDEYIKYLHTFKQKYQTIHLNFHALEGQIVFYDPNSAKQY